MRLMPHDLPRARPRPLDAPPSLVSDLMSTELVVAPHDLPLSEALHLMLREHVRHLLVFDGERLVGVVNDRELATYRSLARADESARLDVVAHPPQCVCTPTTPLDVVARDMLVHRCDAVVVQQGERVVGIFTAVDALRHLAS